MANNLEKLPVNASEALDNLKRRYSDLRTSVTNINSLPEPLYRMRSSAKRGKAKSGERHKVAFMRYGYYDVAFRFFVEECLGAEFVRLPEPTRKSLELGTLNSNDYVCAPFKHILGDYIEALERGADTLVQFSGPCRLHYYGELQESILRDMGYEFQMVNFAEVAETSAKQNIEYCKQGINPDLVVPVALPKFMVTLEMIECLDRFNDAYLETAGFEANPGECKRVRKAYLADMYRVKNRAELHAAQKRGLEALDEVPKNVPVDPIRVGLVGEYFTTVDPFSNLHIEDKLQVMGVSMARMMNMTNRNLRYNEKNLRASISEYAKYDMGPTSSLTIAAAKRYAEQGFDGIVHMKSTGCTPEIDVMPALQRVSNDYNVPILYLSYDSQTSDTGLDTRLEAFYDMIAMRKAR